MIEVTTPEAFQTEVLDSTTPVLVDFWAPWCGPCKALAPTFEALAADNPATKFVKVNVDESGIAMQYGVRGIPTLIMFKNGQPVHTVSGNQPKAKLQAIVEQFAQ